MKKLLFSILTLLSFTFLVAQKPIIIHGKIDNCPNRDNAHIDKRWFNPETLEEETISYGFLIAEDGTFELQISDADNYYHRYWIYLGNEYTHLDLIAGDSLDMTLNASYFDETINYTGRGAGRNNYRRDVFLLFWNDEALSFRDKGDPRQFLYGLNSYMDRRLDLLNNYYKSGKIDSSYYVVEKTMIAINKADLLLSRILLFGDLQLLPANIASQLISILKAVDLSNEQFLQHSQFRNLAKNYPHYIVTGNTITPRSNLKSEIDFAKANYSKLINAYFDKRIIEEYISQANSVSEKVALLNFFESQFNEPVLEKEIRIQKNMLSEIGFVNSEIFRMTLFTIFWFLVLVAFVFLITKIIQYSIKRGVKINISLWLKVVFYLIVLFVSIVFITQNQGLRGIFIVFVSVGIFLVHTYVLIPRFAINKRWPWYALLLCASLSVFVVGLFISGNHQNAPSTFLLLTDFFLGLVLLSWISYYIHQMASGKSTFTNLIKNGELNPELAIHLLIVLLVNSVFVASNQDVVNVNQALFFYTIMFLFYFHAFFTFPRFFRKDKVFVFIGINGVILLIISTVIVSIDIVNSQQALKALGIEKTLTELFSWLIVRLDLILVFLLILIPSFAYYFIKNQFKKLEVSGFKMYRKKEAELAQLRSQVNPHFLFNTLNTLYAFALKEGSEKTAECIAKLANLMRFMLDDMEKESILLQREISYIQDYVKLQSIRSAVEHEISITIDIEPEEGYSIAPMLLIPFVENAFKHAMNPNKVSMLKIDVTGRDHKIQFVIENSIDENFKTYYKEKGFGIGIENVKSRLQYIYPNRHNISIAKTKDKFLVILSIEFL